MKFGDGDLVSVFKRTKDVVVDDVAGEPKAKDIAEAKVEDVLDGGAGGHAAHDRGERVLAVGGGFDLGGQISGGTPAGEEPGIALLQPDESGAGRHKGLICLGHDGQSCRGGRSRSRRGIGAERDQPQKRKQAQRLKQRCPTEIMYRESIGTLAADLKQEPAAR